MTRWMSEPSLLSIGRSAAGKCDYQTVKIGDLMPTESGVAWAACNRTTAASLFIAITVSSGISSLVSTKAGWESELRA